MILALPFVVVGIILGALGGKGQYFIPLCLFTAIILTLLSLIIAASPSHDATGSPTGSPTTADQSTISTYDKKETVYKLRLTAFILYWVAIVLAVISKVHLNMYGPSNIGRATQNWGLFALVVACAGVVIEWPITTRKKAWTPTNLQSQFDWMFGTYIIIFIVVVVVGVVLIRTYKEKRIQTRPRAALPPHPDARRDWPPRLVEEVPGSK